MARPIFVDDPHPLRHVLQRVLPLAPEEFPEELADPGLLQLILREQSASPGEEGDAAGASALQQSPEGGQPAE